MNEVVFGLLLSWFFLLLNPLVNLFYTLWQIARNTKQIDLKRKFGDWAVVTGSTDGIGKEYAKELAKRNINVVLISRSLDKLEATKKEICSLNSSIQVKIIQADFSKGRDEIEKIDNGLKDIPIGILVNNVGKLTEYPMYFGEIPRTDLWDMLNLNIGATTLMTHIVIEKMMKRKKGAIVNVSSGSDATPLPLFSFYAASKTFVRYFSDAIRVEYAKYGITVQTLSPYLIDTKLTNYSNIVKRHPIVYPDAPTYAKNAINTLGKLNSTAGYWIHDCFRAFVFMAPWLASKVLYIISKEERDDYLEYIGRKKG